MTREQALSLSLGAEVHYTGRVACTRTVGPRGGVTVRQVVARVTGRVRTWKRDPLRLYVPVKHGLRGYGFITERSLADWHLAGDCPVHAAGAARPAPARLPAAA
jgi:hypothetical protein